ncbi:exoribonuclease II [Aspergillus saccharolyticus JOP 1030-1]|uniref:RNB-domain-containing protein n=1 Tax=Aspergillus saccharolyticus JOP 1030-1 TaxID=1450539 RepID=A0A318Z8G2_9EURO|nr:RNB-domain-containing protein [Aspergillus saccharolyticus JOP 1030-1]PYH43621.1 RNB-domain-containing protein [Aspergillus saccharolyticus JOP 1030-1]
MYDGCSRMSMLLSKARVSHGVAGVNRYVSNLNLVRRCGIAASRASPGSCRSKAARDFLAQQRQLSTGYQCLSAQAAEASKPTASTHEEDLLSIERLRLRLEFEKHNDIRDYLQKWQDSQDNFADPVRGPGTANKMVADDPWVGNMLNDNREAYDAGADALRASEDYSGYISRADEGASLKERLEPGDLVAMQLSDGVLSYAIYVRSLARQQQFYTDKGKWRIASKKDIEFVVKHFVPPEMVEPLLPHFPTGLAMMSYEFQSSIEGGVPRNKGAPLLERIQQFDLDVRELYRNNALRLDNLHDLVAEDDLNVIYSLEELACKALEIEPDQLNDTLRFLIHRAIHENSFLIESDRATLFDCHYLVRSRHIANVIETVTNWVHEHQDFVVNSVRGKEYPYHRNHPLQLFISKAKRLIRQSRTVRSPTTVACVGPSSVRINPTEHDSPLVYREVLTEKFTDNDRIIIEYLQHWCIPPRRMTRGHMRSAGSHIMRHTGMYNAVDLGPTEGVLFLQELGVFQPWENLNVYHPFLSLPGHGLSPVNEALWTSAVEEGKLLADQSELQDSMKDLRVDWGDLPVYCIDDVGAKEIDDGVSLERIPGSDDTFWVHVHIANPTAFIERESGIMRWAASAVKTIYLPERNYPMMPDSVTQKHFSLGPGRPTLTFSAKMNLQGDILDTKIVSGRIQNVIYLTHERLRRCLQPTNGAKYKSKVLSVGGALPQQTSSREGIQETLTSGDEENFHILRQLMVGWREHRRRNGALEFGYAQDSNVSVSFGSVPLAPRKLDVSEGRYYLGDPVIQLRQAENDLSKLVESPDDNLVSFLMNLGCWVSASWMASRNIPAVYDGTDYHPEYQKVTRENMSKMSGEDWLFMAAPNGVSLSHPVPHVSLGLDVYTKATSPLRRYNDVLAHYQIEAALRFEHIHKRRLDASSSDAVDASVLPFSAEDVDDWLRSSRIRRYVLRNLDQQARQDWAAQLLFRAFYFNECPLPATFVCTLDKRFEMTDLAGTSLGKGWVANIGSLGVRCHVLIPSGRRDLQEADMMSRVEAKITKVDMGRHIVMMEATKLISRHTAEVGDGIFRPNKL